MFAQNRMKVQTMEDRICLKNAPFCETLPYIRIALY
jgi:hypothetical protein